MNDHHAEIFRRLYRPLDPIPTGEIPRLEGVRGIRAVFFDIYGTLFVSDSGEVGAVRQAACAGAMAEALAACGIGFRGAMEQGIGIFSEAIEGSHTRKRDAGIEYPEVDILEIWAEVLSELARNGTIQKGDWSIDELKRLAMEYEGRANPVWPMPGLRDCLDNLRASGLVLGVVSNAQFYTIQLFPALLGASVDEVGFDPHLQYYSYRHGRAKPGTELHQMAREAIGRRSIGADEVLYVGNDMLNDMLPARKVGFRTALFAGDGRSLRLRDGDLRTRDLSPDLVITRLAELDASVID